MRTLTKSLVAASVAGTLGIGSLMVPAVANAQTPSASPSDPMSSLVDKLASKFNLNKNEVQKVFDDERTAREAEREKQQTERLQSLVNDGTFTATQMKAIQDKMKEIKAEREADRAEFKTLTDDQRQAKMDEQKSELESWAKEQGIDLAKLQGIFGGHGGPGGPDHR